jgi:hypothetical protein
MSSNAPEEKGRRFEEFVISKFDPNYFTIVEKTHSWKTNEKRFIESSNNPDYILRYNLSGEEFAVECKYRSRLNQDGMLECCKPYQFQRYKKFMREMHFPVFIVVGLGGSDDNPDDLYVIPLQDMKYNMLYKSAFMPFSKNPKNNFFWKNGKLR